MRTEQEAAFHGDPGEPGDLTIVAILFAVRYIGVVVLGCDRAFNVAALSAISKH
jgi:hypothetical protein